MLARFRPSVPVTLFLSVCYQMYELGPFVFDVSTDVRYCRLESGLYSSIEEHWEREVFVLPVL